MTHVLRCLGLQYSSPEIDQLIREFDDDNSGTVELEEFINIFDKMVCAIHMQIQRYSRIDVQIGEEKLFLGTAII